MSEEEKEAINKTLKETIDTYEKYYSDNAEMLPQISEDYKMAKITLNYIEKLQKENEELKHLSGIDVYKLGQKTQRDRTNFEIDKLQKEIKELREELDYYKQREKQDFDERDYYEE